MAHVFQVAILGAGTAGLSAAERLSSNKLDEFVVLEARDRIGGRVCVKEHKGAKIHMGAQWIHQFCPENPMVQLAKRLGMVNASTPVTGGDMNPEVFFDLENVYTSSGKQVPEHLVRIASKMYKKICDLVEGDGHPDYPIVLDGSLESVEALFEHIAHLELQKVSGQLSPEEFAFVSAALYGCKNGLAHFVCGDLGDCSLRVYADANTLPGDDIDLPYDLLPALASKLPEGCIKLNHVVEHVDWSAEDKPIKITCLIRESSNRVVFYAHKIICTLPIGVLQKNHQTMFIPNLPTWKTISINNISSGSTAKYFLHWEKPWRTPNNIPVRLAWSRDELGSFEFPDEWFKGIMEFSAEDTNQGNLMTIWIGGKAAQVADTLPDDQILRDAGDVLRKFTGDDGIPNPDKLIRECWTKDEFTLGAYSFPKITASFNVFKKMSEPVPNRTNPKIMFAGEATSKNLWSYLHGARQTGIAEADRALKAINLT